MTKKIIIKLFDMLLSALEEYVDQTDTKIDDEIVGFVRRAFEKFSDDKE